MEKLKKWLLSNGFGRAMGSGYEYYNFTLKENSNSVTALRISVFKTIEIRIVKLYKEEESEFEINLFETDKVEDVDRYWILDTIKFLKK